MSDSDNHQNGMFSDVFDKDKDPSTSQESLNLIEDGKSNGKQQLNFSEAGNKFNTYDINDSGKYHSVP